MRITKILVILTLAWTGNIVCAQQIDSLEVLIVGKKKVLQPGKAFAKIALDSATVSKYKMDDISILLQNETGYYIKSTGPNGLTSISARGLSASHTKLFWNNIPLTTPTLGNTDLSIIPSSFFNSVTVSPGSAGVVNGSGTVGSAISLTSSANSALGHHSSIDMKFNPTLAGRDYLFGHSWSDSTMSIVVNILSQKAENDYAYQNTFEKDRLYVREHAGMKRVAGSANVDWTLSRHSQLSYKVFKIFNDKEIPAPIGVANNEQQQEDGIEKHVLSWQYVKKSLFQDVGVGYSSDFSNFVDPVVAIDAEFDIKTASAYYQVRKSIGKKLTAGVKVNYDLYSIVSSGFREEIDQERLNLFGSVAYDISKGAGASLSIREEVVDGKHNDVMPAISVFNYLGKSKRTMLYANASKNLRLPGLNDLYWAEGGNQDLRNESSSTIEFGVKRSGAKWSAVANFYYAQIEDWIQWLPQTTGLWTPMNVKEVETTGIEIKGEYATEVLPYKMLSFDFDYNYNEAINKSSIGEESSGLFVIYAPQHSLRLRSELRFKKLQISYQHNYTSKVYIDSANDVYLPYYAPATFGIDYAIKQFQQQNFSVGLRVNNIYNEDYQIVANQPMPLRNFSISIRINS